MYVIDIQWVGRIALAMQVRVGFWHYCRTWPKMEKIGWVRRLQKSFEEKEREQSYSFIFGHVRQ
jgi:hypothetical protein